MSISSELLTLQNTKTAIRTAINNKGGSVGASDTFASYATAIDNLPSGGGDNSALIDLIERDISGSFTIPSGTTRIGYSAFNGCTSLTSITIPDSVTSIGDNAFYLCTSLANVTIGNGVTTIGNSAFYYCRNIISIDMPNSISTISENAFYSCTGLTSLTLGNSISTIKDNAFKQCSQLTSLVIPDSITRINYAAFEGCASLNYIVCLKDTPPTIGGAFNNTNNCPIYVPAESVEAYKAASVWSTYASRIYPITQLATVDGNPVYNYDLGNKDATTILSTEMAKLPTGTSIEFAEGITNMGGSISGYTTVTLPSTFTSFNDQDMIGSSVTTLTMKSTTPPMAERNKFGGSGLTAIYVPASAVDTYKADSGWSSFASIIQAIPAE